ncbi:hypothetical protein [uncultured Lutibacter sp.]|uniref:hypothetical protein n=1 Tax=uncultured Lutibacter sp. TaxID=437739 RepID=UPI002623CFA7|nr:hypothetical protein [uncultured Lutibacter sp.]
MKSEWIGKYENSEIRVVNTWFNGEMLFVNDNLQDKKYGFTGSNLTGHITNEKGERKEIKVTLGGYFNINCIVFVDNKILTIKKI